MPAFLLEDLLMVVNVRVQHRIHIDIAKILKILIVFRRDRIHRFVRIGDRVQERVQRPFHQFHKRILHGEFVRSAEHGMLDDMRHARTVGRRSAECDKKDLVLIVIGDHGNARSALFMLKKEAVRLQIRQRMVFDQFIGFRDVIQFQCNSSFILFS